jgi:hypothetical protein
MKVAHALDREIKRVAKAEGRSMEDLVSEVAGLVGKSERQIYNWRSGKWGFDYKLIPVLCKRFHSLALAHALVEECGGTPIDVPDAYDLTRLVSQTVREDLRYFEQFLDAFEDGVIEKQELDRLRESSEYLILDVKKFFAMAEADYSRRQRLQEARQDS